MTEGADERVIEAEVDAMMADMGRAARAFHR